MRIFKRARDRKGSLQLSINAIVVLVMAMVVLGLGLGFIRGLFSQGTENLGKVLDNSVLENPATAERPVTVDRNVQIKIGGTAKLRVGFYNSGSTQLTAAPAPFDDVGDGEYVPAGDITCNSNKGPGTFQLSTVEATVDAGQAVAYEVILSAPETSAEDEDRKNIAPKTTYNIAPKTTYICPLKIYEKGTGNSNGGQTQFSSQFYVDVSG